ncbi:MAG: hypothetical protein GW798_15095 [Roseovarius sp.]|nr:hypothetical protein [Roseovarius sp.]
MDSQSESSDVRVLQQRHDNSGRALQSDKIGNDDMQLAPAQRLEGPTPRAISGADFPTGRHANIGFQREARGGAEIFWINISLPY